MEGKFINAWGYQGDNMNLPVADLATAIPFYETVMGFRVESRNEVPHSSAVLERDGIRIGLAENGGDPNQDGCAFQVDDVAAVFAELQANGWLPPPRPSGTPPLAGGELHRFDIENRDDGTSWKVFYIVAPDGLCYWLGELQK